MISFSGYLHTKVLNEKAHTRLLKAFIHCNTTLLKNSMSWKWVVSLRMVRKLDESTLVMLKALLIIN